MSSVGSLSSSTSSSIYGSSNRITGLASGLDTEALIENMTLATRTKIAQQEQEKQLLQWQMDDYRSISSKLIAFQNTYLSYSSETNLRSPNFFDESILSVIGDNSKYVSVSGTSDNVENISIAAVEQLAKNTSYTSSLAVSDQSLNSSEIAGDETFTSSKLEGTYITFSYGSESYTVSLSSGNTYDTAQDIVDELNSKLAETDYGSDGTKLSNEITFELVDGKINLRETNNAGNAMEIKGGSEALLGVLGFEKGDTAKGHVIEGKEITDDEVKGYQVEKNFEQMVSGEGKTLSFTYNGTTKSINLPGADSDIFNEDGSANMEELAEYLETQLEKAFGSGRIEVNYNEGTLNFNTTLVDGSDDTTSVLKFNSGDSDAVKALGLIAGDSNRVNLDASVAESGLSGIDISGLENTTINTTEETTGEVTEGKNQYVILIQNNTIGGEPIAISETVDGVAFDENTSLSDIIEAINASDANVQVTYSEVSDKFTLTSTESGAGGSFSIVGGYLDSNGDIIYKDENGDSLDTANLGTAIFGTGVNPEDKTGYTYTEGQDAVVWVDYDGEGGADPVKLTRSSNTFDIDGLSVTVKGTFGMKTNENGEIISSVDGIDETAAVTFDAEVDSEKITEAVKAMIDAFNEIIELTNTELSEKKNRDYPPLTDEQRQEMTDDQIEAWEEKAKAGMLFNDSDLRSFTSSIRFIFSGDSETIQLLSDMGITTSSNYSDHGKITFDESKFKAALEANPDIVSDLFTKTGQTTVDENGNTVTTDVGIMTQIKTVFDKYASTTGAVKGIFVQKAGATESPLSMLDNYILDQMDAIDEEIEKLQDKLETETERYYSQFTTLETFISQMNSQSSWLTSQFA